MFYRLYLHFYLIYNMSFVKLEKYRMIYKTISFAEIPDKGIFKTPNKETYWQKSGSDTALLLSWEFDLYDDDIIEQNDPFVYLPDWFCFDQLQIGDKYHTFCKQSEVFVKKTSQQALSISDFSKMHKIPSKELVIKLIANDNKTSIAKPKRYHFPFAKLKKRDIFKICGDDRLLVVDLESNKYQALYCSSLFMPQSLIMTAKDHSYTIKDDTRCILIHRFNTKGQ